jgi:hypothetical protein
MAVVAIVESEMYATTQSNDARVRWIFLKNTEQIVLSSKLQNWRPKATFEMAAAAIILENQINVITESYIGYIQLF